jgi:AraC family transcriptional regulator, regulatory protein of adaptative response / methylated-DNA-[protein]-cysteine methyltransferase
MLGWLYQAILTLAKAAKLHKGKQVVRARFGWMGRRAGCRIGQCEIQRRRFVGMKSDSTMTIDTNLADYRLVAQAIEYLDERRLEQPSLEEVANRVGASAFHLQRVFTRWAGISPKRFLQYLTLEHAKTLLAESRPVLDAAYGSGLSGPGRLHDLFVTVEAVTPGEYKAQGAGLTIRYGRHSTPFGECLLGVTERGVCALLFLNGDGWERAVADLASRWPGAALEERPDVTGPTAERIFAGTQTDAERPLSLFLKGTNFQIKVWEALLQIPAGAASTYADVARLVDSPKASRAVGNAVASNSIAYLIPCHRVIRSSGAVSSYRWGAPRKRAMLGWEAAQRDLDRTTG